MTESLPNRPNVRLYRVYLILIVTLTVLLTRDQPSCLYAQSFHELFKNVVFKRQIELEVPGSICLISTENNQPIAVMWRWWGNATKLTLSSQQVKEILGRNINLTDVKVLDQKGNLISKGAQNGLVVNLGTEAHYLVVNSDYHPSLAFPEDLSRIKVYLTHPET